MTGINIRDATVSDIPLLAAIIRGSFHDVAERFGLNSENCPKHPSNCDTDRVRAEFEKGIRYCILEQSDIPCGCVALEQRDAGICYLERLSVLPEFRHKGLGTALIKHFIAEAKYLGAERIEIGIIAEHTELRNWYAAAGFSVTKTVQFKHLPFDVMFMSMSL
jgi:N-acetylglutamate synthase-like GNAT family acetyltransferase